MFFGPLNGMGIIYIHTNKLPLKQWNKYCKCSLLWVLISKEKSLESNQSYIWSACQKFPPNPLLWSVKFPFQTLSYPDWRQWSCTTRHSLLPPALLSRRRRRLPHPLGRLPCLFSRSAFPWPLGGMGVCVWCVGVGCCARQSACGKVGTGRASLPCAPVGGAGVRPPPWIAWRRWGTQSSSGLCGCACVSVERNDKHFNMKLAFQISLSPWRLAGAFAHCLGLWSTWCDNVIFSLARCFIIAIKHLKPCCTICPTPKSLNMWFVHHKARKPIPHECVNGQLLANTFTIMSKKVEKRLKEKLKAGYKFINKDCMYWTISHNIDRSQVK